VTDLTRRQQIEAMLRDEPNDPFLRYALAMEYASEGADAEAERQFQQLLADAPDYVAGYFQYGQLLARAGRVAEARHVLERGIAAARQTGDQHAADEMRGLLLSFG
jgi:predicted Zn-dependent protease